MKTFTKLLFCASTLFFFYSCDPEDLSSETSDVLIDDVKSDTGNQEGDILE